MIETLKQYPSSPTNNARSIVRGYLVRMNERPSEKLAQKIEDQFGIISDFDDKDLGNEPDYSHNRE